MTGHDHLPWSDDLAAYALGALEPHETAALEGHLIDCDRCRAELARIGSAVEQLPASVVPVEPPRALRRRIMEAVEAETAVSTAPAPTAPSLRRLRGAGRRSWLPRPALALTLAAVLAAGFAGGVALRGGDGGDEPSGTTLRAQALTNAPVSASLVGGERGWRLEVARLPALSAGRVYEVWIRRRSQLRPSSLFVLSRDGRARVSLPDAIEDGDQVLVTREPAGGSAQPTSEPLLQIRA